MRRTRLFLMFAIIALLLVPSVSFAKSKSQTDTVNGVKLTGRVSVYSTYATASSSRSSSVGYMTVKVVYKYGRAGQPVESFETVTNSDQGYNSAISTRADAAHYGPKSIDANSHHTWVVGSNQWTQSLEVNY